MTSASTSRICFLTTSYPDYPGSYRGSFVQRTALGLMERGHQISIVTPRVFKQSKRFEEIGAERIYRFSFLSEEKLLVQYERIPVVRIVTYMLSGFLSCMRVLRRDRCQLIHAHFVVPAGLIAVLVGRALRVPVIVQAHGSDVTKYARLNSWMAQLSAFTVKKADHIVAVSDELRTILIQELGASADKITVRSCGVDIEQFRPIPRDKAREQFGLSRQVSIVLLVGSLIRRKGIDSLLSAIASLAEHNSNLLLLIVGDGPLHEQLAAQARELSIEEVVRFVGRRPSEEMPLWYSAADVFVLPSLREGTPLSLLEALSCGVPVIVSRAGGMPEVVEDGKNGLLVDIGDPVGLGEKIDLLIGDSDLRQRFKEAARDTVLRRGGIQEEVDTIENLYRELGMPAELKECRVGSD